MKKSTLTIYLLLAFGIALCTKCKRQCDFYINGNSEIIKTSISDIISQSDNFDNHFVNITGYLQFGFEFGGIYENKFDCINKLLDQVSYTGICVDLKDLVSLNGESIDNELLTNFNGERVLIIGKYCKNERGHLNNCIGEITEIQLIYFFK